MRKKNVVLLAFLVTQLIIQPAIAKVKLPAIVSSNMVLQRNTTIKIWGWADANEKITIKTSWLKAPISIQADADGNWMIDAKTTDSKAPQTISLKSNTSDILLENILFGEVWLCSGQSNMEMPMKGFFGQPTFGSAGPL
jgi:sialate O-acetylesterase